MPSRKHRSCAREARAGGTLGLDWLTAILSLRTRPLAQLGVLRSGWLERNNGCRQLRRR